VCVALKLTRIIIDQCIAVLDSVDVAGWALAMLLAMQSDDGRTIAATLVDAARATDFRISASAAPYSCREALKAAG